MNPYPFSVPLSVVNDLRHYIHREDHACNKHMGDIVKRPAWYGPAIKADLATYLHLLTSVHTSIHASTFNACL